MMVITANRLDDGRVVYRADNGAWTRALEEAQRFADEVSACSALKSAEADAGAVVGPYLIETDEGAPSGKKIVRETIRLSGPSAGTTKLSAQDQRHV